ncbi:MAG: hypothetical protein JWR26_2738 [Pedosphaera sp.]|nr:hypothetical protein [Pedosphaera sp.]
MAPRAGLCREDLNVSKAEALGARRERSLERCLHTATAASWSATDGSLQTAIRSTGNLDRMAFAHGSRYAKPGAARDRHWINRMKTEPLTARRRSEAMVPRAGLCRGNRMSAKRSCLCTATMEGMENDPPRPATSRGYFYFFCVLADCHDLGRGVETARNHPQSLAITRGNLFFCVSLQTATMQAGRRLCESGVWLLEGVGRGACARPPWVAAPVSSQTATRGALRCKGACARVLADCHHAEEARTGGKGEAAPVCPALACIAPEGILFWGGRIRWRILVGCFRPRLCPFYIACAQLSFPLNFTA